MRLAVVCVVFFLVQTQLPAVQVETYRREEIIPLLPMLNAWADREFAQYPYLLFPSDEQIVCPSDLVFVNSRDAMIAVAKEEDKIVGLAAMISFDSPVVHALYFNRFSVIEKCAGRGIDISRMLYVAYFLTDDTRHNDPLIVEAFYQTICNFAHEKGKSQICFMEDITEHDAVLRPAEKICIEPWGDAIHEIASMGLQIHIAWPTRIANNSKEIEHTLEFFTKDL